jgi:ABC-type multidrug transport system fused ATPase/permease subunit
MAPKQRQIRIEQRSMAPDVMEQMQARSDEQLENERKYRSVAYSILGARAAERYDAPAARAWFQKAMVASTHQQERIQIRRMADASLALAERRAGDLKVAVEKLGQQAPSSRQLFGLRVLGLIAPSRGAKPILRIRGALILIGAIIVLIAIGTALVKLISLPFGGLGWPPAVLLGVILDIVVFAVLAWFGRRRQRAARARAAGGS